MGPDPSRSSGRNGSGRGAACPPGPGRSIAATQVATRRLAAPVRTEGRGRCAMPVRDRSYAMFLLHALRGGLAAAFLLAMPAASHEGHDEAPAAAAPARPRL